LNEFKTQQDLTLNCIEQWIIQQVEHTSQLNELEVNHTTIKIQEEMIILQ